MTGPDGVRLLPIQEFYSGPGRTVREHAELLTAVLITRENYEGFGGHYIKYGKREAMEIATMGLSLIHI